MAIKSQSNLAQNVLQKQIGVTNKPVFRRAIVTYVFLNVEKGAAGDFIQPGTIRARPTTFGGAEILAYPIDESMTSLPLVDEIVDVFIISSTPFYRRLSIKSDNLNVDDPSTHRLKLNDGDTIIQSRYGQSIRLGLDSNPKSRYPTLILRNGESQLSKEKLKADETVQEDINRDGGTIVFSSGKNILNFVPGAVDRNGKSNFQVKVWEQSEKYALEQYPKKLDGNQIVIASDRLILSSRQLETMIFSKGPMSLISDSYFTLDSNKGMSFVSQLGDIQFEAKDQETKFFVGKKGKIFLGIDKDSPSYALVNGKALVDAIGEIVNEIIALTYGGILTPAGPTTGISPDKQQKLKSIMSKLPGTLSKKVFIGM